MENKYNPVPPVYLVQIWVCSVSSNRKFTAYSEIIEWSFPLPIRGDIISFEDEHNSFKMIYRTDEHKYNIHGNAFEYKYKTYFSYEGKIVLQLMFGDFED